MGDSLDNTDTSVDPTVNLSIANYDAFANYLRKAVTILLPEEDVVPESLNSALDDPVNQDIIRKFLSDPQVQALYVQRNCIKGRKDKNDFLLISQLDHLRLQMHKMASPGEICLLRICGICLFR